MLYLLPLKGRKKGLIGCIKPFFLKWWRRWDSNPLPMRCERIALPDELRPRNLVEVTRLALVYQRKTTRLSPCAVCRLKSRVKVRQTKLLSPRLLNFVSGCNAEHQETIHTCWRHWHTVWSNVGDEPHLIKQRKPFRKNGLYWCYC